MDELHAVLAALTPREPFELDIRELGWFPNERSPRVLWAGVQPSAALKQLMTETEERLFALGVAREEKASNPHLTLARIKNPAPLRNLRKKVEELQPAELGSFPVRHFCLFRSDPGFECQYLSKAEGLQFREGPGGLLNRRPKAGRRVT